MSRPVSSILLPTARVEQLKALAEKRGLSLSAIFDDILRNAIVRGELPDTLPGFEVVSKDEHVWLVIGDFGLAPMPWAAAFAVATTLETLSGPDRKLGGRKFTLAGGFSLSIARAGRGIVIAADESETGGSVRTSITPGMAEDLSRIIFKACKQVK
jgi:hypothetical protein